MIAIVGGGITGLSLGRELKLRGVECVVLEARAEAGGVIRSARVGRHVLDWGPQRARLTQPFRELVEELGLDRDLVVAPPALDLFVYRDGSLRRVPFSVAAFLSSDLVGPYGKARAAMEVLTARAHDHEAVSELFTRKFGRELYEHLLGPLYGGLYASDPKDMVVGLSLGHVLREFGVGRSLLLTLLRRGGRIKPPPACSFAGGMQSLPRAIAESLGDRVRLGNAVQEVRRAAYGWRIILPDGELDAEHVVFATPAPTTSTLLTDVAPDASRRIGQLRYNPLGVVHLEAETELRGMGFQVSLAENRPLKGVTFNNSLFGDGPGREARAGLYTAYLGGASHPEVVAADDAGLSALAVAEFRGCTGYDASPLAVAREAMPAWDRSWSAIVGLQLPDGLHLAANWESRPGLPGRFARARKLGEQLARRVGPMSEQV